MTKENKKLEVLDNLGKEEAGAGMTDSEKLDFLVDKVGSMDNRLQRVESDVAELKSDVSGLKREGVHMNSRLQKVERDITGLKVIVENEIWPAVRWVAEGHLDLMRKLEETKKPSDEVEVLSIRVSKLESDMYEVKQKFA